MAENDDIKIEGDLATWSMRMEGALSGTYVGTFKFRCFLTPLQQIAAGKEQRELLGSSMALATEHEQFLAYALTQLRQRITLAPPFWASSNSNATLPGDLPDENIVEAVLDAAIRSEIKYKEEKKKKKEESLSVADKVISKIEADRKKEIEDALRDDKS